MQLPQITERRLQITSKLPQIIGERLQKTTDQWKLVIYGSFKLP